MKKSALIVFLAAALSANAAVTAPKADKKGKKIAMPTVEYTLDTEASKAVWTGKKIAGPHTGTIKFKEGTFIAQDHTLSNGEVVMDMTTIANDDLKDPEYNKKLVTHLKSADFFDVEKYPTARFKMLKFSEVHNFVPGQPNAQIKGEMTLHGVTRPETVLLFFTPKDEAFEIKGKITLDRTKYGLKYNSKKFFDVKKLGDKLIDDHFDIDMTIITKKK